MPDTPSISLTSPTERPTHASPTAPIGQAISRRDFTSILSRAKDDPTTTSEQQARDGAEQFVAIALIQPILKQLRETNNAAPPFAPSSGEKQFQTLFDNQIAGQIVRARHFPLVDRIASDLLKHNARLASPPRSGGGGETAVPGGESPRKAVPRLASPAGATQPVLPSRRD